MNTASEKVKVYLNRHVGIIFYLGCNKKYNTGDMKEGMMKGKSVGNKFCIRLSNDCVCFVGLMDWIYVLLLTSLISKLQFSLRYLNEMLWSSFLIVWVLREKFLLKYFFSFFLVLNLMEEILSFIYFNHDESDIYISNRNHSSIL